MSEGNILPFYLVILAFIPRKLSFNILRTFRNVHVCGFVLPMANCCSHALHAVYGCEVGVSREYPVLDRHTHTPEGLRAPKCESTDLPLQAPVLIHSFTPAQFAGLLAVKQEYM